MTRPALIVALCLLAGACTAPRERPATPASTLTLASWNMEHLAERNDSGCRPRSDADYAAMRAYAEALDADVIAFQEVESRAAAERVFDPARYTIEIEQRVGSGRKGECGGQPGLTINPQRTGFAIRKGVAFERQPDVTDLQLGSADLRSGVDLIVRPAKAAPIRLLSVHLKAGCNNGDQREACPVLFQQVPVLERWIDQRAGESLRFAVLGDFNRRLAQPGDAVWADWDDASPANADLARASGDQGARCNPRYRDFIDYIVLDRRASGDLLQFEEKTYAGAALSDHCAISAQLQRR
ncbi:endonuclease/exonuclease/phosphatase family protein [Thermomonas fusca]|uniref:Endonuclease n=1 Tax=Thermomonas fusca TaxID=215690 RepID=A0A5R9PIJ6_9GAMM|nr:endonuclease/exonuclease/phosphatase family protein [Thermomonas fusca]TLX22877.1 endonuclease [Thermomonas fusca]